MTDPDVAASELDRIELPLASWPALERLRAERALVLGERRRRAHAASSLSGARRSRACSSPGSTATATLVGFLAVGYRSAARARPRAGRRTCSPASRSTRRVVLQNARLLEEVRAASALKSEFVGAISHELRSPLNVILGYLEMLLDEALGPLTAEQRDALRRDARRRPRRCSR